MRSLTLSGLLFCLVTVGHVYSQEKPKNILFIAVDDLKPLLNHYGYPYMHTPNFDRLAKRGVSFSNAQVQQAVCGPSRASIMTGTYPDRTKVWDLKTDFRKSAPELVSMPEFLITQGYETAAIGKIYHKPSSSPGHDGKSWSIPYITPENYPLPYGPPAFDFYQSEANKETFDALIAEASRQGKKPAGIRNYAFSKHKPSTEAVEVPDEAYQDGAYALEAIQLLKELKAGGKPFFLGVGFQKPHLPFIAPKKYWDLYDRERIELAAFRGLAEGTPSIAYHSFGELRSFTDIDDNLKVGEQLPEAKQRELIHGYIACVSYIDAQLGKLLDALEAEGLAGNTLIVLWGDHGYHLGDHTLWNKHSNFEQATRIPLMFAGPGVPENVNIENPVALVDVFPTLFELAGVEIPAQAEGTSLVCLWDEEANTQYPTDFALSQFHRKNGEIMGYSIRTNRYRYTEWHGNYYRTDKPYSKENIVGAELYDYVADPNETKNLLDAAEYREVRKEMEVKLFNRLTKHRLSR